MQVALRSLLAAATIFLTSCVVPVSVQSYTAADGSSRARYGVRCLYPTPLSSTELRRQPEAVVQLDIYGVLGNQNTLSAAVVIEKKPETTVRLVDPTIVLDSTDFREALRTEATRQWARPEGTEERYSFTVSMPSIPKELSLQLPALEIEGKLMPSRTLLLKHERRLQPTGLCQ